MLPSLPSLLWQRETHHMQLICRLSLTFASTQFQLDCNARGGRSGWDGGSDLGPHISQALQDPSHFCMWVSKGCFCLHEYSELHVTVPTRGVLNVFFLIKINRKSHHRVLIMRRTHRKMQLLRQPLVRSRITAKYIFH